MAVTENQFHPRVLNSALQRSIVQGFAKLRENRIIRRPLTPLALLGLFTLPLGILVRQLVWEFDVQIKVISQKRIGLSHDNSLMKLLANLLEHRLLVYQLNTSPKTVWKQQEIDRELKHLKEQNRLHKIPLKTEEFSKKIDRDWQLVLKAMENKNLTRQELYTLQSSIIGDTVNEILDVGNTSDLILDDSLDTYYLGNTLINLIPTATEKISRARDLQADLTNQTIDPRSSVDEVRSELIFLKMELQQLNLALSRNRATVMNVNSTLELPSNRFLNLNRRINKFSSSLLEKQTQPGPSATSFQGEADEAIYDAHALYDTLLPITDRLLESRLIDQEDRRRNAIKFTGLSLITIISIYLLLTRSLQLRYRAEPGLFHSYLGPDMLVN